MKYVHRASGILCVFVLCIGLSSIATFSQGAGNPPPPPSEASDGLPPGTPPAPRQKPPVPPAQTVIKPKPTVLPPSAQKAKYFTLNFKDAEITEFLNMMSQFLNKNIIIDDRIRGQKITITSAKNIPVSEAFEIMKSILEVKGFAVVETENLIKVIPIRDAIKKNVEIITDGKTQMLSTADDKTITMLITLTHANCEEVANVLRGLKSQYTDILTYQPLNTIIISGTSAEIDGLIRISKALDRQLETITPGADPNTRGYIHVVNLKHSNAEDLAGVLSRVPFSETALTDNSAPAVRASGQAGRTTGVQPVQPGQPGQAQAQNTQQQSKAKLSIIANKETNSLIITAKPDEYAEIYRIIQELDIVREQVLIEVLILEVSAENGWGFGIDWMLGANKSSLKGAVGGSSINGTAPSYTSPVTGKTLAVPAATGFQLGYLGDSSILNYVLLNATGTDTNFNVLSTPQLLTTDNQEAELNVGEDVPVQSNYRVSDTGTTTFTYDYKSVGIKMKITPHISRADHITLDLYQEANSILKEATVSGTTVVPPTLGKRDIKTKVTVRDGKTIVVGGLISNKKTETTVKVPVLGDIPLLGWAFKHKTVSYAKSNLLIFITPHVVTQQERLDQITKQKRLEQKSLRND